MEAGAVLKATLQEGEGEARPKDGDLVRLSPALVYNHDTNPN